MRPNEIRVRSAEKDGEADQEDPYRLETEQQDDHDCFAGFGEAWKSNAIATKPSIETAGEKQMRRSSILPPECHVLVPRMVTLAGLRVARSQPNDPRDKPTGFRGRAGWLVEA